MSSAADIRARKSSRIIPVTLPGTDLVIECRRPELLTLASRGWVDWPSLQQVQAALATTQAADAAVLDNRPVLNATEKARTIGTFLDEFICAAAVRPRVVLTEAEVVDPDTTLWIDDIELDDKLAIFDEMVVRAQPAVAEFRGDESTGAVDRSGGEAVRDTPVDAAVGAG